ncbi:MAG TPA: TonB-dependent receptor, partial [Cyclobacteriaceae bacterium]|nr:TonB-dependent receptor [Cyclobacteriaceae bacterium]
MQTLATFFFIVMMTPVFSQTRISGKVTDASGEGIPGANLSIKDSYDGASSALDGSFSFTSDEKGSHTLVISFVGYKAHIQPVELTGKEIVLNIVLKEEINQLDGVVISAGSFTAGEEKRRTILKPVDIAMTAGATADIAGALNTLPGTQKVGETGRLFVRGGDGSETRTFIDGMVVLDAYGPSAPNTPSRGRFMPFMFKGTSFSTGGYSAEYGQALSSALVLNSKDKAEMNQTDIGILSVGADVAHTQVWDRASVSGKVQYTNIRPYFNLINQEIDWKTPPASLEASAAYRQQVGKTGKMKFYGNFNQTDYSLYNHDILDPSLKQQLDLTNRYRYINGSYQQEISSTWSVRGGLSYSYNQNNTKTEGVPATETEAGLHSKLVFE